MLVQEDFVNAYVAWMSGIAEWYNDKEIIWPDDKFATTTIEFVNNSVSELIVRRYNSPTDKKSEILFKDNTIRCVRSFFDDGNLSMEQYLSNGMKNGVCRHWHPNGQLASETYYDHGIPHGTKTTWYDDGDMKKQEIYEQGKVVRVTNDNVKSLRKEDIVVNKGRMW